MNAVKADYFSTFEMLAKSIYEGIPGVVYIDSGVPGPVLGITVCTHGNEPAGLGACRYLLGNFDLKSKLKSGSVYFVLNNILAASNYFNATNDDEAERARYVDFNMNRMPEDTMTNMSLTSYEAVRSRELLSIWRRFTAALDIHSTTGDFPPMIISRGGNFEFIKPYIKGFPITTLISNIDVVQIGLPPLSFYGEEGAEVVAFGIEAGQHEKPETFINSATCVLSLLKSLEMIDGEVNAQQTIYTEYKVVDSLLFDSKAPDLADEFKSFQFVAKGTPLVSEDGRVSLFAEFDCHLLFPTSKRGDAKDISEEIAFITLPARQHIV